MSHSISKFGDKTANNSTLKNKKKYEQDDTETEDTQLEEVEPFRCKIPSKVINFFIVNDLI